MNSLPILVILLTATILSVGQTLETEWFGQKWLDENYLFKWKTNHLEKVITFRVEVMTKGWVGFGFSKRGKTSEVDMVIGWVDDWGHSTFNDFWVNELGNRSLDMSQDWDLISGVENATHTVLQFRRNYITCDEANDLEIFENDHELSNIIIAYNFIDPDNIESINEPIFERLIHLNLFEKPEIFNPKETDIEVVDLWLNVSLGAKEENVYCLLHKNKYEETHQIIKYEPYSLNEQWKLNRHMLWFSCPRLDSDQYVGKLFKCYDSKSILYPIRKKCNSPFLETILNNEPEIFPDNVGFKIEPVKNPYFIIEGHLKNPTNKVVDVRISLRVWMTRQLRKFDTNYVAFSATFGVLYNTWGFIVPPNQPSFKISFLTSSYCLENDGFLETGIQIFKMFYHQHHAQYFELRHYRNNQLVRNIKYYHIDNEWQPYRSFKVAINLRKGDKLVGVCDYVSISENKSYTTPHEHCAAMAYYYPATPVDDDRDYTSRIPYNTMLKITGLQKIDGYDTEMHENIIIREPVKYNNTKLIDFISENKYKINDPKELEELQIRGDMSECCYYASKVFSKTEPCQPISKPPGLYHSIMKNRKQNSCPFNQKFERKP